MRDAARVGLIALTLSEVTGAAALASPRDRGDMSVTHLPGTTRCPTEVEAARASAGSSDGAPDRERCLWRALARPTPLAPDEERAPATAVLARRFNPAMAFVHEDVWPVSVDYAFAAGAPLVGRLRETADRPERTFVALTPEQLRRRDWGDLPASDADGRSIDYLVDGPGDDRVQDGVSSWRRQFRRIQLGLPEGVAAATLAAQSLPHDRARVRFAPTQYAHLFWWNRERGLLAIQYWFFYPYNEWINHHEGDWEHVNVILHGPGRLDGDDEPRFRVAGYQFFFHRFAHEPDRVIRVADARDSLADHVVVYVGGRSRFLAWTGIQSGGSYPLPARYPRTGGSVLHLRADDDVRGPVRFIAPREFDLVLLPEPERLDVGLHPELSWLRLSFFAGQPQVHDNPLALNGLSFGNTPRQPARQATWNAAWHPPEWPDRAEIDPGAIALPPGFVPRTSPLGHVEASTLSARRAAGPGAPKRPRAASAR